MCRLQRRIQHTAPSSRVAHDHGYLPVRNPRIPQLSDMQCGGAGFAVHRAGGDQTYCPPVVFVGNQPCLRLNAEAPQPVPQNAQLGRGCTAVIRQDAVTRIRADIRTQSFQPAHRIPHTVKLRTVSGSPLHAQRDSYRRRLRQHDPQSRIFRRRKAGEGIQVDRRPPEKVLPLQYPGCTQQAVGRIIAAQFAQKSPIGSADKRQVA